MIKQKGHLHVLVSTINPAAINLLLGTLRLWQNVPRFANDILKSNFGKESSISFKMSLFFKVTIDNNSALVQILVSWRLGDKPLSAFNARTELVQRNNIAAICIFKSLLYKIMVDFTSATTKYFDWYFPFYKVLTACNSRLNGIRIKAIWPRGHYISWCDEC